MKVLGAFLLGNLVGAGGLWLLAEAMGSGAGYQRRAALAALLAQLRAWSRGQYAITR